MLLWFSFAKVKYQKVHSKFETSEWFKISHTCYVRGGGQNRLAFEWCSQHWFSIGAYHSSTPVFNELSMFSLCTVSYRCLKKIDFGCLFFVFSMLCFGVIPSFSMSIAVKHLIWTVYYDENFMLLSHFLSISIVNILSNDSHKNNSAKRQCTMECWLFSLFNLAISLVKTRKMIKS